ncbi:hypothetical protein [Enterovirga rhinocerotis]|uniref:hypothetical protein n=1 Tax=Enterovirga rhinocerotis TaxID=1339210 RepID=UPI00105F864D|nr:hypothetical protein [Enterovirga rhinocerotis]
MTEVGVFRLGLGDDVRAAGDDRDALQLLDVVETEARHAIDLGLGALLRPAGDIGLECGPVVAGLEGFAVHLDCRLGGGPRASGQLAEGREPDGQEVRASGKAPPRQGRG